MTPKLKLREHARKALLSCMRKCFWLGMRRTTKSTQMMVVPAIQARVVEYQRLTRGENIGVARR